jgi:hypothetical protein
MWAQGALNSFTQSKLRFLRENRKREKLFRRILSPCNASLSTAIKVPEGKTFTSKTESEEIHSQFATMTSVMKK